MLLLAVVSLTVFLLGRRPGRQEPLLMLPLLVQLLVFAWFWVGAVTP